MSARQWRGRILLGITTILVAGSVAMAPAASATACPVGGADITDGVADSGRALPAKPLRYEYENSPYLGVRRDDCAGTIKIYYGGYTGITHYNLRVGAVQREIAPLARGVVVESIRRGDHPSITVQACKRGGIFESSSCTRWSPTITI
jgi:hypothetical protein